MNERERKERIEKEERERERERERWNYERVCNFVTCKALIYENSNGQHL